MKKIIFFILFILSLSANAFAQTASQKLLPNISLIGVLAAGFFSDEPTGETGHDPARSGITLQEIELALQSTIDPYLKGDVFFAFHEDGVELEEGFVTTLFLPKGLQIKAGKFLLPFGRQNQKHLETWDFVDMPLVNKYLFGPENLNELAVEASYLFPIPFFLQAQATFSNGDNETSFAGERREDFLYQGRLSASVDPSQNITILWGTSGAFGANSSGLGNLTRIVGGDLLFKWKPKLYRALTWQSEYIFRSFEDPTVSLKDGGLYSYVDYQFSRRWHAGTRFDQVGWPSDALTKEWRVTPALTFNPTEFSRLRTQYSYDKITGERVRHSAFLQLEFSMGVHGTHPF